MTDRHIDAHQRSNAEPTPDEVQRDVEWRVRQAELLLEQAHMISGEAQRLLRCITGPGACEVYQAVRKARQPLFEQLLAVVDLGHPDAKVGWGLDEDGLAELKGEEPWVPHWHDPAAGGDR